MKIVGIKNLSVEQLKSELQRGGKFVIYQYSFSVIIMSFKRSSNVHLIKYGESSFAKGLLYTLPTLLLGWWGIPWGPIYTVSTVISNSRGGKDVTEEVKQSLNAFYEGVTTFS
ncbi:hypothetical protein [Gorillibacterium timonense]|uniref:hypothetical protein n=1 Tax=Gorillibacterium timonense TaxID=1689269 RepID=UPI00071DCDD9|nr:hypothetical protein [Gorillibacterium timonense]